MYDNFVDNLIEAHGQLQNRYQRLHAVAEHRRRLLIDEQQELEIAETVAYGLHENAQRLRADLARVTSERDEEVQSNVELREKLYNVRNDNDRLREAVNSLLREWHGWAGCLEDHPPTFTAAIAAAEAALKGDS